MDGRVLFECMNEEDDLATIPSWDDVPGHAGCHPAAQRLDPELCQQALDQLVALGYVEPPGPDAKRDAARASRELDYNLARSLIDAGQHAEAGALLCRLYAEHPGEYRFAIQLAICYRALNQINELEQLLHRLNDRRSKDAIAAAERLRDYKSLAEQRSQHSPAQLQGQDKPGQADPHLGFDAAVFSDEELREIRELLSTSRINQYAIDFFQAYVHIAKGEPAEALALLNRAARTESSRPGLHIQIGDAYFKLRDYDSSRRAYRKALELDAGNPHALVGVARNCLRMREFTQAAKYALESINQMYFNPHAHYLLGRACLKADSPQRAANALLMATRQNPNFPQAHRLLAAIYESHFGDAETAEMHRALCLQAKRESQRLRTDHLGPHSTDAPPAKRAGQRSSRERKADTRIRHTTLRQWRGTYEHLESASQADETVTIVTGLPRSGTSMMMRMLAAGGLCPLFDHVRQADEDNPNGYYELEKVKRLSRDNGWLDEAKGKSIKVIAQLVELLPKGFHYRIVFMQRELGEVIQSQRTLLARRGETGAAIPDPQLMVVYRRQLAEAAELLQRKRIPTVFVPYHRTVADPVNVVNQLCTFLPHRLDGDKMITSVDPSLYRNRGDSAVADQVDTPKNDQK